ncbi:hypothetical protein [Lacrimispora sp. JR3]|uniref:hypothetical protein n=1 Tax=Lacrimispora sinapis TaxID=3111456 RepID=UPI003748B803
MDKYRQSKTKNTTAIKNNETETLSNKNIRFLSYSMVQVRIFRNKKRVGISYEASTLKATILENRYQE